MAPRDRRAIARGKRPVVESIRSSSDEEDAVPLSQRLRRPVGGVVIGRRAAGPTQPPPRATRPSPAVRSAPPPAASLDSAGPEGEASTMTLEDVECLRVRYSVPSYIRLFAPGPEDRVTSDRPGQVALYEEFFRCGLRLPLHPFVSNLLDWYRLAPAQLTPNSIRIICCFVVLCFFHGSEARLSLFRVFYKLRHHAEFSWSIFASRPGRTLPLNLPSKIKGWKSRFFFAEIEGVRVGWGEPYPGPNKNPDVEERDRGLFDRLVSAEIPPCGELLKEENLVEVELAPAMAMKVEPAVIRENIRKRRQAAGEVIQPTRRMRRRVQTESAPVAGESGPTVAVAAPSEEVPTGRPSPGRGPSREGSADGAARRDAPQVMVLAAEDVAGRPDAGASTSEPAKDEGSAEVATIGEAGERSIIVYSPLVWTGRRPEEATITSPESAGNGEGVKATESPVAGSKEQVAGEPTGVAGEQIAGGPATEAGEPVVPPAEGETREELVGDGGEASDSSTPAAPSTVRRAVKKMSKGSSGPRRSAPRISTMEDARQAERLLERLRQPESDMQIRQLPTAGLLDGAYASMLQAANMILGIRDRLIDSADARAQTIERAAKLKNKCRKVSEEAKKSLEAAEQRFTAVAAERDTWRNQCRDAEHKAGVETSRAVAAENKLAVVARALESAEASVRALESARDEVVGLTRRLRTAEEQAGLAESRARVAEERADMAWSQAQSADEKAAGAEKRAQEAEKRVGQLEGLVEAVNERAAKAEEEARAADTNRLLVVGQLWDAQARFEEAESRAWQAESKAKEAEERGERKVHDLVYSKVFEEAMVEAASDSYLQGFEDCRAKIALAYSLEGTEAIRPGDPDAPSSPDADEGEGGDEVVDAEGEGAGDAPQP